MPVAIQSPLPPIAFSQNEIWLKVFSDDFRSAAPAAAVNYLQFTGAIAADTVILISWTGGAATMKALAVPDNSGGQFPTGNGSAQYVEGLVDYFAGNYFIDRDFEVAFDGSGQYPRLIFTARKKGPEFNLSAAANVGVITPGVTDATRPNFRHHVQILISKLPGFFTEAYNANVPLDTPNAGLTSIDIHHELQSFFVREFDVPALNSLRTQCLATIKSYFVKYGQFFGTDPAVQRVYKTGKYVVAKGGLGMQAATERDIMSELRPDQFDKSTWRCLRQGSKNKLVRKDQPEWLYWINLTGETQAITLEVTIYNDDDTSTTFTTNDILGVDAFTKWQFQAGFEQLGIAGRQGYQKVPVYYTCRVKSPVGYLSASYAYVIDYNYEEWSRYFVYENAYGGFQTLCTTGKGQTEFERKKDDAQITLSRGYAAVNGEVLETNIIIQDKGTVNIGYGRADARSLDLLRDFFTSHRIYLYAAGKLIPVGLSTTNIKDAADGTNVYASAFEYFPLYQEEVFTEDPTLADDDILDLIGSAGSALPVPAKPGDEEETGTIVVEYADSHLSMVNGRQTYTAPFRLYGRTNYRINSTQLGRFLYTSEVAYDAQEGSFAINIDQFQLQSGDQLIIFPYVLNPDGE